MTDRSPLLAAWALLVFGLAVRCLADGLVGAQGGVQEPTLRPWTVDVNRASIAELQLLPGVGPVRAEAIVLERVRRGAFVSLADLSRVDGLGPQTVEEIAAFAVAGRRTER